MDIDRQSPVYFSVTFISYVKQVEAYEKSTKINNVMDEGVYVPTKLPELHDETQIGLCYRIHIQHLTRSLFLFQLIGH